MKESRRNQIIRSLQKGFMSLDIELTRRCNNNCIHCYINKPLGDKKEQEKEMDTVFIKRIIDEAYRLGLVHCLLTGGEPLVRSDFIELYTHIRKKGIGVTVATNGVLIDAAIIKTLRTFPPKCVNFSLYGFSRASYARIAGVDDYQKAWENLLLLNKNEITLFVKIPVFRFNMNEIQHNHDWLTRLTGNAPGLIFDLFLRGYHDDKRKDEQIRKLRLSNEERLQAVLLDEKQYRKDKRRFCSQFLCSSNDDHLFGCGAAKNHGAIDAYGCLQPCMSLRTPLTKYDLKKGSLHDGVNYFFSKIIKMKARSK